MDWNIKSNRKHLIAIVVLCALIPHVVLTILQTPAVAQNMAPVTAEAIASFFVREWIPFWAAFIALLRLQKRDSFSLFPLIVSALIIPVFISGNQQNGVMVVILTLPLLLVMECFALLKKLECSGSKFLAGIAADRKLLRAFFFWSVAILCVAHIACAGTNAKTLPLFLLPVPGVLLYSVFRQLKDQPPTPGGVIGMIMMVPVSLWLAASGPMAYFRKYHLAILLIGFVLVFLMMAIYHMDHWRKPKK